MALVLSRACDHYDLLGPSSTLLTSILIFAKLLFESLASQGHNRAETA